MFEIRNYHYDPTKFDAYRQWAEDEAVPFLKANLDIIGFWIDNGLAAEYRGTDPMELKHGAANITWIIRWESKAQRDERFPEVIASDEWQAVWAKHPDPNGYQQMLGRFLEAM